MCAAFDGRDAAPGELTPLDGQACISASGSGGECMASPVANSLADVVMSPNGHTLYLHYAGRVEADAQTGVFTSVTATGSGKGVWGARIRSSFSSDGRFVYTQGEAFGVGARGVVGLFPNQPVRQTVHQPPPCAGTSTPVRTVATSTSPPASRASASRPCTSTAWRRRAHRSGPAC